MRVLLCVDDDPVLDEVLCALEWGLHLPRWREIVALHVIHPGPLFSTGVDLHPVRRGEAFMERVRERLSHFAIQVKHHVSQGDPAQQIVRIGEECEADLIVMGARGERRDFLMGSVSQKVVSLAATDVLVVREGERSSRNRDRCRSFRALVAVDGSLGSEAGVEAFTLKLRAQNACIRLVHAVEAGAPLWDVRRDREGVGGLFRSMESEAWKVLLQAKESLERHGFTAECEWRSGPAAAQILDAAREFSADVIVVGSRGHSAIRERVLGSITQRVLRHAPCTVLCARGWAPESGSLSRQWSSRNWEPEAGMA